MLYFECFFRSGSFSSLSLFLLFAEAKASSGNPSKTKKKSTDDVKSTNPSLKVKKDKSKSMFIKPFSVGNVDFVAKKIKKERLSDTGNVDNDIPSTSGLFSSRMESSTVQNGNNNNDNSNEDHNVSSSSDFLDVFTSVEMESESDHTNLTKAILDSKECDTSTAIDGNIDMSDDIVTPVCLNAPQNRGVIQFFSVDTDDCDGINRTACCNLCGLPVRAAKKATSNLIRHMMVCEYYYYFIFVH